LEEGGIKMKKVDEVEINKWEIVGKWSKNLREWLVEDKEGEWDRKMTKKNKRKKIKYKYCLLMVYPSCNFFVGYLTTLSVSRLYNGDPVMLREPTIHDLGLRGTKHLPGVTFW
jgi:hypothetical protein